MGKTGCCFSGHRNIPKNDFQYIQNKLQNQIKELIQMGFTDFYAGGALGFDTMSAIEVLKLKTIYPQIRLHLFLPCKDQTKGWKQDDLQIYNNILERADSINYSSETYTRECIFDRNRALVDHSSYCICYLSNTRGGTAYTVKYARSKGLSIINLFDDTLEKPLETYGSLI